jgi:hypothetical protein
MLDRHSVQAVEKMVEKEHLFVQGGSFANIQDDFYQKLMLDWDRYCNFAVYPIFRFCQLIPLKNMMPMPSKPQGRQLEARVVPVGEHHEQCYMLSGFRQDTLNFQLVIANNHSVYDDYSVSLKLEEPKLRVGDIYFEPNASINHDTFIKHYFPDLHLALDDPNALTTHGITDKKKIIPIYFTTEDYDD